MTGDGWVGRVSKQALRVGQKVSIEKHQGLGSVCGVGGTNIIKHKATVPFGVPELGNATYSGSLLENSE
eukprot:12897148-Prorocentrum_lima.AAC.1